VIGSMMRQCLLLSIVLRLCKNGAQGGCVIDTHGACVVLALPSMPARLKNPAENAGRQVATYVVMIPG
jgi:predicted ATPase